MSIFAKNSPIKNALGSNLILLYGQEKGGKSTLAAGFPKAAVIDTEGGHKQFDQDAYVHAATWPQIKDACAFVVEHKKDGTVVFDSLSRAYDVCRKTVLAANGWADEREGGAYGAGFAAVRNEFRSAIDPLLELPARGVGVVLVTHTKKEVIEKPTGDITIVKPEVLDNKTYDALARMADVTLYYAVEASDEGGMEHVVRTHSDGYYVAGDRTARFPARFTVPHVTGTPTERAKQVYAAVEAAYEGGA